MEIKILNELIPLMRIIAIGIVTNSIIDKLKAFFSSIKKGKYSFTVSFSKVDK